MLIESSLEEPYLHWQVLSVKEGHGEEMLKHADCPTDLEVPNCVYSMAIAQLRDEALLCCMCSTGTLLLYRFGKTEFQLMEAHQLDDVSTVVELLYTSQFSAVFTVLGENIRALLEVRLGDSFSTILKPVELPLWCVPVRLLPLHFLESTMSPSYILSENIQSIGFRSVFSASLPCVVLSQDGALHVARISPWMTKCRVTRTRVGERVVQVQHSEALSFFTFCTHGTVTIASIHTLEPIWSRDVMQCSIVGLDCVLLRANTRNVSVVSPMADSCRLALLLQQDNGGAILLLLDAFIREEVPQQTTSISRPVCVEVLGGCILLDERIISVKYCRHGDVCLLSWAQKIIVRSLANPHREELTCFCR
jgi:hypothetical protein